MKENNGTHPFLTEDQIGQ